MTREHVIQDAAPSESLSWASAGVVAAGLVAAFAFFAWPTIRAIGQAARLYPDYSHCALIPFLAVFLAWTRKEDVQLGTGAGYWIGVPVAAAGLLLSLLGSWYQIALQPGYLGYVFLLGVGVVLACCGGLWSCLGTRGLRALAVPVAFLLFAVPLPESAIVALTAPLRTLAVVGATRALQLCGLAAHREGNIIELAKGAIGVDDACSGIRSVWVLLAFAVFMYSLMRLSGRRTLVLLLAVPVMAVAANLARIGLSAWAVARGHSRLAEGTLHELMGVLTTTVAAAAIAWLGHALGRSRGRRPVARVAGAEGGAPSFVSRPLQAWGAPVAVGALLVSATVARGRIDEHYRAFDRTEPPPVVRQNLSELPTALGADRQITVLDLPENETRMLKPDDRLVLTCATPSGVPIYLRILYWNPQQLRPSDDDNLLGPHNPDLCYPAVGWVSDSGYEHEREFTWSGGQRVGVRIFRKLDRQLMMFFWQNADVSGERWFVPAAIGGRVSALIDSWTVPPVACRPARYGVVATAEVTDDPRETRRLLEDFCRELVPQLPACGIGR